MDFITIREIWSQSHFFCIGDNINKFPEIFNSVLSKGHSLGNHTFNHLKGWETSTKNYIENVAICQEAISKHSKIVNLKPAIFRPPYGRIKSAQAKELSKLGYKIIMWDILTADFDADVNPEQCLQNVLKNVTSGSIIVFHDSKKAFRNLEYALPKTLELLKEKGFSFAILE